MERYLRGERVLIFVIGLFPVDADYMIFKMHGIQAKAAKISATASKQLKDLSRGPSSRELKQIPFEMVSFCETVFPEYDSGRGGFGPSSDNRIEQMYPSK